MLDTTLLILAVIALLLVNATGVLLVAFQMPGTWLMLLSTGLFAWWQWGGADDEPMVGWWALAALLGLAVLGEVVEFIAGALGASGAGSSRRGAMLAVVGGVIGAILGAIFLAFLPIVGVLIGAAIGAGAASLGGDLWAGREWGAALKTGQGAVIGKFAGAVGKLAIAVLMWVVVVVAVFWP